MRYLGLLVCLSIAALASGVQGSDPPVKFELKDGDRVAFIGNTFVEREANDCYIETMLTSRFPDRNITFRNLGYSADTVTGSARGLCIGWSAFEAPDKAFERLRKLVAEFKPTVLLMNYGMTESFTGPEGISQFTANYNKMLDALSVAAGTSPRIVLMSPNYHEDLGRPLPDPAEHNRNLGLYSEVIAKIAKDRNCGFIDLFYHTENLTHPSPPGVQPGFKGDRLTSNGIHLTPYGYWCVANLINGNVFGMAWQKSTVAVNPGGVSDDSVSHVNVGTDKTTFIMRRNFLPSPPSPYGPNEPTGEERIAELHIVAITGLQPGKYRLSAEDRTVATNSAEEWAKGIYLHGTPDIRQAEALCKLIVAKNFDFFNYERPDNDAYILAFRRGEQGRNAPEIPQFLPLVAEKEKQIAELRVPKPVTYTLEAVK